MENKFKLSGIFNLLQLIRKKKREKEERYFYVLPNNKIAGCFDCVANAKLRIRVKLKK